MTFEEDAQSKPFEKSYRVFLYQHIQHGWYSIFEQNGSEPPVMDSYVRLSEGVDIKFTKLDDDEGILVCR